MIRWTKMIRQEYILKYIFEPQKPQILTQLETNMKAYTIFYINPKHANFKLHFTLFNSSSGNYETVSTKTVLFLKSLGTHIFK